MGTDFYVSMVVFGAILVFSMAMKIKKPVAYEEINSSVRVIWKVTLYTVLLPVWLVYKLFAIKY